MAQLKTLNVKSNEGVIYAMLGWKPCLQKIHTYENCKKTPIAAMRNPTECYTEARDLQSCYSEKAMSVEPLCLPIFNDCKECLFQGDTNILACKQELNELVYCNQNPRQYKEFLSSATAVQRKAKVFDFYRNAGKFNKTG